MHPHVDLHMCAHTLVGGHMHMSCAHVTLQFYWEMGGIAVRELFPATTGDKHSVAWLIKPLSTKRQGL